MNKIQQELINSTLQMSQLLDSNISVLSKLEMILQLFKNLEILKTVMDPNDFETQLGEINKRVNRVIGKIGEPDFPAKVAEIFNRFLPDLDSSK